MIHFKLFSLIDILFFTLLFCLECWCQNSISRHERENILTWEGGWKRGWNLSCFNYCLWWELGNWQFWPDYPCLSLHWDYRRQVLLWTVLPVCNWDPGWQTFVRPATLAGFGRWQVPAQHSGAEVSPVISMRCHTLSHHQLAASLWPVGLSAVGDILALAKWAKLDLLGSRAALCSSFGKKRVGCCLFGSWRQTVLGRWLLVRAVIMRQNGDVIY